MLLCDLMLDAGYGPLRSDTVQSSLTQPVANRANTSQPGILFLRTVSVTFDARQVNERLRDQGRVSVAHLA
jgi:hypothetical protein